MRWMWGALVLVGCQETNVVCPNGEQIADEVCFYSDPIVIETGFDCPPEFSFRLNLTDGVVCSDSEISVADLPDGFCEGLTHGCAPEDVSLSDAGPVAIDAATTANQPDAGLTHPGELQYTRVDASRGIYRSVCAMRSDGEVFCWFNYGIGTGQRVPSGGEDPPFLRIPFVTANPWDETGNHWVNQVDPVDRDTSFLYVGGTDVITRRSSDQAIVVFADPDSSFVFAASAAPTFTQITAEVGDRFSGFACGVMTDGSLACGGDALDNLCYDCFEPNLETTGMTEGQYWWVSAVIPPMDARAVQAWTAYGGFCAVYDDGSLRCLGTAYHQTASITDGVFDASSQPIDMGGAHDYVHYEDGCALRSNGEVDCFDANHEALLPLAGVAGVTQLDHNCVLEHDESVWCWESDLEREPIEAPAIPGQVTQIASDGTGHYAVTSDGRVYCWGQCLNFDGTYEASETETVNTPTPIEVPLPR